MAGVRHYSISVLCVSEWWATEQEVVVAEWDSGVFDGGFTFEDVEQFVRLSTFDFGAKIEKCFLIFSQRK